jgi:hypothetical protein
MIHLLFTLVLLSIPLTFVLIDYFKKRPKFKVGDFIGMGYDVEEWDKPPHVIRIDEVGKKRYKTSFYVPTIKQWRTDPVRIYFTDQHLYTRVRNPEEK